MIARTAPRCQIPRWQRALAEAVTDPAELLRLLELDPGLLPAAKRAAGLFGLRVPRGYLARMAKGDPDDPLLRQVLPLGAELLAAPGYGPDPVGDAAATARPGLLNKYHGRALLITTGACAVHCRYCFRRGFPYGEARIGAPQWERIRAYLESEPAIDEVILSGGDPLVLSDQRLAELVQRLDDVAQLQRLRIHSRVPLVLPERIGSGLQCSFRLPGVLTRFVASQSHNSTRARRDTFLGHDRPGLEALRPLDGLLAADDVPQTGVDVAIKDRQLVVPVTGKALDLFPLDLQGTFSV